MLLDLYIKDLKVLLSDKKGLLVFMLMPIVLTTILSFALSGSFGDPGRMDAIPVAVVSQYERNMEIENFKAATVGMVSEADAINMIDSIDFETMFFETFLGDAQLKEIIDPKVMTLESANLALDNEEVIAIIVLPEGFIFNQYVNFMLPSRNPMTIDLIQHPDYNYSGQIVQSIFESYFDALNKQVVNKNVYLTVGSSYFEPQLLFETMGAVAFDDQEVSQASFVEMQTVPGKKLVSSFTYYAIAMMGMFILYSAGYMGRELLNEKKMLTLDRGVVSGVLYGKVLAAKFMMTVTLCFVQMNALILFAAVVLKVDWSNPLKVLVGILFSSLAVSGVGVLIGAITLSANNYKVANIFENLLIHVFAFIGGSYLPVDILPQSVIQIKYLALNGIVIDLFIDIYQNAPWSDLVFYFGMLTGITVVFTGLAVFIIKRKEVASYVGAIKA